MAPKVKLYQSASGFIPAAVLALTGDGSGNRGIGQGTVFVTARSKSAAANLATRRHVGHWATSDWTPDPAGDDVDLLRDAGLLDALDRVIIMPRLPRAGYAVLRYDGPFDDSTDDTAWTVVGRFAYSVEPHDDLRRLRAPLTFEPVQDVTP